MFSEAEILKAIEELEKAPTTYQDAEKLATFYILRDHLHTRRKPAFETVKEVTIDRYSGSEFYHVISGKKACDVWRIVNEVMGMLKATEPYIYKVVVERLMKL